MTYNLDLLEEHQNKLWVKLLAGKIPDELVVLSNPDGAFYWDQVNEKILKYFAKQCLDQPWVNHFALAILCLTDRNLTPASIMNITSVLNARFRDLFSYFKIASIGELKPYHVEQYVTGQIIPEHSDRQRQSILTGYNTFVFNLKKWLGTQFIEEIQLKLTSYMLPHMPFDNRDFSARAKANSGANRNPGLLIQGLYLTRKQRLTNKLFINIEPLYIACMFARFALDIITSSGARINELLQISYDKDCCVVTVDNSVNPPQKNYIFRLTPKGKEEPENYYMPEEVFKFMTEIVKTLKEAYRSDKLPEVEYDVETRKHLMPSRRYIFQYQSRHINVFTIIPRGCKI
ncbi:hypothetical protein [Paenibacillus cremeus]|uniref:Uncharacterized protein n=1 Tax=Paenibacillus cremeus TaxID=2163881 RepID=A0A559K4Q1_9BACL|nr:hypothetical protein [Paenibacillus cremeus]TVY07119.1 hypothetical protein FPZ49_25340 [Paenibacillus cremeus]